MKKKNEAYELTLIRTPLAVFLASYNQTIPSGFPRASTAMLRKFQGTHPTLFKHGDEWSVAQHRKKLMDWLSGGGNAV
ncbi:MAG: hypothetical protein A3A28_03000 [Candidatus Sungbacteria bacterium RIFCSPLOWO2_01_FULL_47_32]|uniref:Uncharacterized protein n=1 Tax=Candidatus Sungbacteria bacterium RIFCSPHIGHO2_01_FULL_47_32 TaxID=1802264 RepID=A0A1G2K2G1_9BACT|nr:MAG: hypothetical protein UX72_C0017G0055 [Parcubacteria group bacterium GW2011_GWA2_47_10]OGZ93596.1 MAG: hypothetical protein A2633_04540 [Candidatus Sungbacteria bacterium RIFCSPHIGHO2_01_FULL_47_32]OHA05438.1 MAG: hypothetical protein A3A28_03000 [Candidatus Sungbacteria bacterium RIFCSPLOWO2_01_FULL_47_32]